MASCTSIYSLDKETLWNEILSLTCMADNVPRMGETHIGVVLQKRIEILEFENAKLERKNADLTAEAAASDRTLANFEDNMVQVIFQMQNADGIDSRALQPI